jgi:hypothetical protein
MHINCKKIGLQTKQKGSLWSSGSEHHIDENLLNGGNLILRLSTKPNAK